MASNTIVLVTGGLGFLASYCIIALLNAGYQVRATVRSLSKTTIVQKALRTDGSTDKDLSRLTFVEADLDHDKGWNAAVAGCTYVHHVASPIPTAEPKDANDLIMPAREGTLRVLRAGRKHRNCATGRINLLLQRPSHNGRAGQPDAFTEEPWSNPNAKLIAERAAWESVRSNEGKGLELTCINSTAIFGPVLSKEHVAVKCSYCAALF